VSPRAVSLTCAHLSLRQARGSVPRSGVTIVDAFCGSGVVTHAAAVAGYHVESFDTESYARTLAAGATAPFTEEAEEAIRAMQAARSASGAHGLIAIEYSPSGPQQRMFWTAENAAHIDAARQLIPSFSMECQPFLLASLLVSADAVANTTGVYGAYLKQFKTAALNPMVVRPLHKCTSPAPAGSRVLCGDDAIAALAMLAPVPKASGIRMVYADPPYNQRQYSANYAPLKLLSEYQAGAVRAETKSGLAIEAYKSTFCRRTDVASAFEGLVTSARACADYLVVSYSSDGLLNRTDLDEILGDRATCQIIEHKRYRAARGQAPAGSPTKVSELLYVVPL
jgi:adenine-specific DNA methylase